MPFIQHCRVAGLAQNPWRKRGQLDLGKPSHTVRKDGPNQIYWKKAVALLIRLSCSRGTLGSHCPAGACLSQQLPDRPAMFDRCARNQTLQQTIKASLTRNIKFAPHYTRLQFSHIPGSPRLPNVSIESTKKLAKHAQLQTERNRWCFNLLHLLDLNLALPTSYRRDTGCDRTLGHRPARA